MSGVLANCTCKHIFAAKLFSLCWLAFSFLLVYKILMSPSIPVQQCSILGNCPIHPHLQEFQRVELVELEQAEFIVRALDAYRGLEELTQTELDCGEKWRRK